ncbi:hypothetical protein ElyMa_000615100 [Elysia marginata]|uniref:Uncharacterized protein n=1 Tax=Elysia marginata TaxID=1093978 RepID=A0AAV4G878_9GAST|nr:hypothetical protein ElyMa_000615100 [Elysia marginata]
MAGLGRRVLSGNTMAGATSKSKERKIENEENRKRKTSDNSTIIVVMVTIRPKVWLACFIQSPPWLLTLAVLMQVCLGTVDIVSLWDACEHHKAFTVNNSHIYKVTSEYSDGSDFNATALVDTCKITLSSQDNSTWLCVRHEYPRIIVAETLVRLSAECKDGGIFSLENGQTWTRSEKCCKSSSVDIIFQNKNVSRYVDLEKVKFDLMVMEITSRNRRLDMTLDDCDFSYDLKHSEVSVYNRRDPEHLKRETAVQAKQDCLLYFDKLSGDERRVCVVYIPLGNPDCSSAWRLRLLEPSRNENEEKNHYDLKCEEDVRALQPHAECSPSSVNRIILKHSTEPERAESYRVVVIDYLGDPNLTETQQLEQLVQSTLSWAMADGVAEKLGETPSRKPEAKRSSQAQRMMGSPGLLAMVVLYLTGLGLKP